jgi:hypothetical protein
MPPKAAPSPPIAPCTPHLPTTLSSLCPRAFALRNMSWMTYFSSSVLRVCSHATIPHIPEERSSGLLLFFKTGSLVPLVELATPCSCAVRQHVPL